MYRFAGTLTIFTQIKIWIDKRIPKHISSMLVSEKKDISSANSVANNRIKIGLVSTNYNKVCELKLCCLYYDSDVVYISKQLQNLKFSIRNLSGS